jgi:hypothetical protein
MKAYKTALQFFLFIVLTNTCHLTILFCEFPFRFPFKLLIPLIISTPCIPHLSRI